MSLFVVTVQGVAVLFVRFLQKFFAAFPQYQNTNFYIFGESYAGDAFTSAHPWYPEMGHFGGQQEGGHAPQNVISKGDYYIMTKGLVPACELGIVACNRGVDPDPTSGGVVNASACFAAYDACNFMAIMPYELTGKNPYDMRKMCTHGRLCYDFDMIGTYLNKPEVQTQLGVQKKWGSCNYAVDLSFVAAGDWLLRYQNLLPDLLADGIDVLIYAGDVDYICNWLGNKASARNAGWVGTTRCQAETVRKPACSSSQVAKLRSSNGLNFMQVFEAPFEPSAKNVTKGPAEWVGGNTSEFRASEGPNTRVSDGFQKVPLWQWMKGCRVFHKKRHLRSSRAPRCIAFLVSLQS
ncbi:unnamed protein product [Durusdinium trenchii]|uniref:Carboxypeptidase n=1 Tax=Durusdinium trenchii TaxID=1381693 RepID=A0ABP0IGP4_9DINO